MNIESSLYYLIINIIPVSFFLEKKPVQQDVIQNIFKSFIMASAHSALCITDCYRILRIFFYFSFSVVYCVLFAVYVKKNAVRNVKKNVDTIVNKKKKEYNIVHIITSLMFDCCLFQRPVPLACYFCLSFHK